jgi:hypothetical protein
MATTIEPVNLPSWGRVFVWKLPEVVRRAFVECLGTVTTGRYKRIVRAKLIARCVVDEKLKPVFTDTDWKALSRKPEAELAHVFKIACKVNLIPND